MNSSTAIERESVLLVSIEPILMLQARGSDCGASAFGRGGPFTVERNAANVNEGRL